jgi:hypothetical protein
MDGRNDFVAAATNFSKKTYSYFWQANQPKQTIKPYATPRITSKNPIEY